MGNGTRRDSVRFEGGWLNGTSLGKGETGGGEQKEERKGRKGKGKRGVGRGRLAAN